MRRLACTVLFALAAAPAAQAGTSIVEVRPAARAFLTLTGARELSPSLGMWAVPSRVVSQLRSAGLVKLAQPVRRLRVQAAATTAVDPLVPQQWYLHDVGADQATAPGPGVPITIVDTGVDVNHPELTGRPNVTLLNQQSIIDSNDDYHGTAVTTVAAAPENGVGITGVYPEAVLREYDADLGGQLTDESLIAGIEAALAAGKGVINLSLGGTEYDQALQDEIYSAIRRGSLVVAASGNSRDQGNPLNYPANMTHVLTVAATDQTDRSAPFSSSSPAVDLAAPGVGILAGVPTLYDRTGYTTVDGTSFASPIVAAAAAWVWTARPELDNTQLPELLRQTARDVEAPGFDVDTGFGIVNIPAALTASAPAPDPEEPNDDIDLVKPNGLFATGLAPLTGPTRRTAALSAHVDFAEDPEDVYRVWVPAGRSVTVGLKASKPVALQLWRPATRSVEEIGAAKTRDLAATVVRTATAASLRVSNRTRAGAYYYADVFVPKTTSASYRLTVAAPAKLAKP